MLKSELNSMCDYTTNASPVTHALVLKVEILDEEGEEWDEAGLGPFSVAARSTAHGRPIHTKIVAGIEICLLANKEAWI